MYIDETVTRVFEDMFHSAPAYVARAPGRVNLLGEHVDYNDGFVLPAAIDRATHVAFSPTDSNEVTLRAMDLEQDVCFTLEALAEKKQLDGSPLPDWARYPAGVAWALAERGLAVSGVDAVFASDVPRGAGLSSSASVELAFAVMWKTLGGWDLSPMEMARLCQRAENRYVGVNCGIMDQFASACGEADRLLLLDCRSLEYRTLPLPNDVAIVIADTSVRRSLTTSAYNDRRAACEEAVRLLQRDLPEVKSLRDVSPAEFDRFSAGLPAEVEKRARHIVQEIDRTQRAIPLLEGGDVAGFGRLMNECHVSLRDHYEVSCPELDTMTQIAWSLPGCYGARLTGAGFGGCTVNLVAQEETQGFVEALADRYHSDTELTPEIYVCKAAEGAGLS